MITPGYTGLCTADYLLTCQKNLPLPSFVGFELLSPRIIETGGGWNLAEKYYLFTVYLFFDVMNARKMFSRGICTISQS